LRYLPIFFAFNSIKTSYKKTISLVKVTVLVCYLLASSSRESVQYPVT